MDVAIIPSLINNPAGAMYSKPNKGCVCMGGGGGVYFETASAQSFNLASNSPTRQLHEQVNIAFSTNENQRSLSSRSYTYVAFERSSSFCSRTWCSHVGFFNNVSMAMPWQCVP